MAGNDTGSAEWINRRNTVSELKRDGDFAGLVPYLKDPHPRVARDAAFALGQAKYAAAVPALIDCLEAKNQTVSGAAAYALGSIGDPSAVEPLIALLARLTRSRLRFSAVIALRELGDKRALPALRALTEDEDSAVRNAALGAIFRIEPPWTSRA